MCLIPFFKAICAEVVISTSDSETHMSLSNNVAWIGSVFWLYERKCYLELEATVRKESVKSALLLGTSGVGKSLFMKWLMWRLVSTRGSDTDISFRVSFQKGKHYFCTTRNGGTVEVYDSVKHGKPDYYFSDGVDVHSVNLSNILTLLVSSDEDVHFEQFNKVLSTHTSILDGGVKVSHGLIIYMPLFSFAESMQLERVKIGANHLAICTLKYDIVGGSARNFIRSGVGRTDRKLIEFVGSMYDDFFPADAVSVEVRKWAISIIVDALISATTDKRYATLTYYRLFRHCSVDNLFKAVEATWASPFLTFVAGGIVEWKDGGILDELKRMLAGPGGGYVSAYYHGHEFLRNAVADKEPYPVFDLSASEETSINLSVKRIVLLRTVEDVGKLKIGDCGIATTTNFPLVDAVVKGATMAKKRVDLLINFASGTKLYESSGTLPMLTAMLGPTSRSVELFIVPEAALPSFKGSGHDIAQYVTPNVRPATNKALSDIFHSKESASAISSGNKRQKRRK